VCGWSGAQGGTVELAALEQPAGVELDYVAMYACLCVVWHAKLMAAAALHKPLQGSCSSDLAPT
jgi:hypothetical protein